MVSESIKDRNFGIVIGVFFIVLCIRLFQKGSVFGYWVLPLAGVFLITSIMAPGTLRPLNRVWTGIGLKMGSVMTPVTMLIIYILAVLPTAFIMRILGKDPLRFVLDKNAGSYWISRNHKDNPMGSMKNQF